MRLIFLESWNAQDRLVPVELYKEVLSDLGYDEDGAREDLKECRFKMNAILLAFFMNTFSDFQAKDVYFYS